MQLDPAFGAPEFGPVVDLRAQVNQTAVQTQQLVFKTELFLWSYRLLTFLQQRFEHTLIQLPGTVRIGIGQGGFLGSLWYPQMFQFAFTAGQSSANLAQGLSPSQLAKQHRHKLSPTGKSPGMTLGLVLPHRQLELGARKSL